MPSQLEGADWPPWPEHLTIPAIGESSFRSAIFMETSVHRVRTLRQERHKPGGRCVASGAAPDGEFSGRFDYKDGAPNGAFLNRRVGEWPECVNIRAGAILTHTFCHRAGNITISLTDPSVTPLRSKKGQKKLDKARVGGTFAQLQHANDRRISSQSPKC